MIYQRDSEPFRRFLFTSHQKYYQLAFLLLNILFISDIVFKLAFLPPLPNDISTCPNGIPASPNGILSRPEIGLQFCKLKKR